MPPLFFLTLPPSLPLSLIAVDVERGVCGLLNMGNTCYMNAGLQCIRNLPEIATYYLSTRLHDAMLILRNYQNWFSRISMFVPERNWSLFHCIF